MALRTNVGQGWPAGDTRPRVADTANRMLARVTARHSGAVAKCISESSCGGPERWMPVSKRHLASEDCTRKRYRATKARERATERRPTFKRFVRVFLVAPAFLLSLAFAATSASAAGCPSGSPSTACPGWEATFRSYPTNLPSGGGGTVAVQPLNVGAADSIGEVRLVDTLPAGVTATDAGEFEREQESVGGAPKIGHSFWICSITPGLEANSVVSCSNDLANLPTLTGGAGTWTDAIKPGGPGGVGRQPRVGIAVHVAADAPEGAQENVVEVSGGGALGAVTVREPLIISSVSSPFGFARWQGWFANADGTLDTQAGSVPYSATFSLALNNAFVLDTGSFASLGGEARDFAVDLPAGFVGDPTAVPQCTRQLLEEHQCPHDTQVGIARAELSSRIDATLEIYNMVPPRGVAAAFAFPYEKTNVFIYSGVRAGSDYGVESRTVDAPQQELTGATVTLWGVPADPSHDVWRRGSEGGCEVKDLEEHGLCNLGPHPELTPLLRLPTSCGGPQSVSIWANTWLDPDTTGEASFLTPGGSGAPAGFGECAKLPFEPSITESDPTTERADSPTGLRFGLHVPQPEGVVAREEGGVTVGAEPAAHEADLKDVTIAFPAGLAVNPSEADGLQACSEAQVGFTGFAELDPSSEPGARTPQFTPGAAECPEASKLGTVKVKTPLLGHELAGAIYLARQGENPFGSLLAVYIAIDDPVSGIIVKLPGEVRLDPTTGQISTVVNQDPQVPFEDFHIELTEGARAPLTTPATCGEYGTTSLLSPWDGNPAVSPTASFMIGEGPAGGRCAPTPLQEPNSPSFQAGTVTPTAGAYSSLVVHLSREDGSQEFSQISVTLPPGATGKLSGIPECSDAQIAQAQARKEPGQGAAELASPSCPESSKIGTVTVGSGAGPTPFYVTGDAYLAGPYNGAPFSAVFITPAIAGPFDLGTVVVRAGLYINPSTAQVTTKSDPLPRILDGIPLDIRSIAVAVTRPGFTLNPTSCAPMSVIGEEISTQGAVAALSNRFQVGGCEHLPFKPVFTASTDGHTSKVNGASLRVKITSAGIGQANIAKVDLTIPNVLPSRLTTLQKACTEAQFNTNPAACPSASNIATATVHTPLLNSALSGPVYFVSHGGAAFPDTEIILQGEGVKLVLDGHTQIKNGVTYSRFETVPDAPFTSFEFNAPEGPYSIFGANANLCQTEVHMPTTLVAQNGAVINQSTLVEPEGCPNTLTILSHKVKKRTITLRVAVPAAGKLTVSGKGLTKVSKTSKGRGVLTLTFKAKGAKKLKTKIKLKFAPTKGRKLATSLTAKVR